MLIRIGEFAHQSGVTIKALHHYEKLGLLKPAWINRFNGYRYYAPEQHEILDLLLTFKDMGFSLDKIAILINENLTFQELRAQLEKQITSLEKQLEKCHRQILKTKTCLGKIKNKNGRVEFEQDLPLQHKTASIDQLEIKMRIQTKHLPAFTVVGMRYQGKNKKNEIADVWTEFNGRMNEVDNVVAGETYGICNIPTGLPDGDFEYICALPVRLAEEIPTGMISRSIEEMEVAVFEHRGSHEKLGETYTTIYQKWLPEAGLQPLKDGFDLEMYDEHFKDFSPDSIMYIYVPLKA